MVDNVGSSDANRRPGDSSEGVRILGAEEAAQAMQRGDVVGRRSGPQHQSNRTQPPPVGPRPALRFPLDANSDPQQFERPAVRPSSATPNRSWGAPVTPDDPSPEVTHDVPGPAGESEDDTMTGEATPASVTDHDLSGPASAGPVEMQHWTAAPTGEVPAVLGSETGDAEEDLDAWSSFASSSARWHDNDWDQGGFDDVSAMGGADTRVGAMDEARPTNDELFSFDDLDEQARAGRDPGNDIASDLDEVPDFRFDATLVNVDRPSAEVQPEPEPAPGVASRLKGALARRRPKGETGGPATGPVETPALADGNHDIPLTQEIRDEGSAPPEPEPGASTRRPARRRPRPLHRTDANQPPPDADADADHADDRGERPAKSGGDVGKRVLVGLGLMGVFGLALAIGSAVTLALVVVVMAVAALEFFNSVRQVGYQPAVFPGLLATVLLPISVYYRGLEAVPLVLALTVVFGMLWYLVGADGGDGRLVEGLGLTMFGVGWIGVLGSFAAAMLRLEDGRGMLMAAVLATVAYDIAGFFVGRSSAGHTPLIAISPNKTREGLIGGVVMCLVMCVGVIGLLASIDPFDGAANGLALFVLAALAAPLGDLCESLVKRDLGLKDMGALLPGHGGLLDRIDGLLFVLPATYFALVLFSIGPFST